MAACLTQPQQRRQQRIERIPVQAAEVGCVRRSLSKAEDGGFGGVCNGKMILTSIEVILDGTELKPGDLVGLRREIDLAGNVLFRRTPKNARHDVVHRAPEPDAIRVEKAALPPLEGGVRLQTKE